MCVHHSSEGKVTTSLRQCQLQWCGSYSWWLLHSELAIVAFLVAVALRGSWDGGRCWHTDPGDSSSWVATTLVALSSLLSECGLDLYKCCGRGQLCSASLRAVCVRVAVGGYLVRARSWRVKVCRALEALLEGQEGCGRGIVCNLLWV